MLNKTPIGVFKLILIEIPNGLFNTFFYINPLDLSTQAFDKPSDVIAIYLQYGRNFEFEHYSSLVPAGSHVPLGNIGVHSLVASRLGLKEGDEVLVSYCTVSSIHTAYVYPKSGEDFEIVTNLQNLLEDLLMFQIRIVAPKQVITVKAGNITVDLILERIEPAKDCGRLEKFTQLIVSEAKNNSFVDVGKCISNSQLPQQSVSDYVHSFFKWLPWSPFEVAESKLDECEPSNDLTIDEIFQGNQATPYPIEYRVIPIRTSAAEGIIFTNYGFKTDQCTSCKITVATEKTFLLPTNSQKPTSNFGVFEVKSKSVECSDQSEWEVYLPSDVMKRLNVGIGSRVFIEELQTSQTVSNTDDNQEEPEPVKSYAIKQEKNTFFWESLREIYDKAKFLVTNGFKLKTFHNILLTAPSGCGKSFLLKTLAKHFETCNFYHLTVDCKTLRGKKIDSLLKIMTENFSKCAHREPSILFLDDLDALMLEGEEQGENSMSDLYCYKLAAILTELAASFQTSFRITIIASVLSLDNLSPALSTVRGPRLFNVILSIPELSAEERQSVLNEFGVPVDESILNETQGYRIQDIIDLVSRAKLHSFLSENEKLDFKNIKDALEDTVPIALLGAQLKTDIPYKWDDVGGMVKVKADLDEIFRWPSKYPEIFSSSPLRLQSGALLFGPPGCGKTLVAGALANECGMNFMSVKGPELLSKFVGASEAAVRSLFERASQAQPCLLFFDELDSLAPRRGHDSTGVTDRVVNQLLTQLDGVESRTGIWVLGASSRPDLIDPALLRPGRLDRAIHCTVPNQVDRFGILQVLARSLTLADDIDLADIASSTENFTGADLQALLYTAQLKAAQLQGNGVENMVITNEVLQIALKESRPSLSLKERLKFEVIYKRFSNTKDLQASGDSSLHFAQKVTFA